MLPMQIVLLEFRLSVQISQGPGWGIINSPPKKMIVIVIFGLLLLKCNGISKSVQSLVIIQFCSTIDIILQPVSINTTLNSTVIFTCEAIADELSFRVNNEPSNDADVINKGFTASTSVNGTLRGELQAIAYDFNNNTNIRCRALSDNPPAILFSNTAVLMIQGLCVCMHTHVCLSFFFLRSIR